MLSNSYQLERVNLGCGPNAPTGWLNIDGSWNAWLSNHSYLCWVLSKLHILGKGAHGAHWNVKPLVHDLTKPLPFDDNTVSFIYGAHVLEHLYLEDAKSLLLDCKRVLKPSGVIRLVVPDLHAMVQAYVQEKAALVGDKREHAANVLNERLGFRSPEPPRGNPLLKFYYLWKDFHHHKWMYDSDSLMRRMETAGFVAVRQREYLQSDIPGIDEVEEAGRVVEGAGVCVEGRKP